MSEQRKIIHIDMDAFYASVEQRDFPEYLGKPLIVGGSPEGRGGVVAAASYEARTYGVRSAMPSKTAVRLCPEAIFVRPRFETYKAISAQLHEIFHRHTDLVEPLSLDEAYLDVTTDKLGIGSAIEVAQQIRFAIKEELQLTASAGVSINKFVAKIASDLQKPDGLTFIEPSRVEAFIAKLPVEKFFGVGKVTAAKMKSLGLHTGADLRGLSKADMLRLFGKTGAFFYGIVRGIDPRPVQAHREPKSISVEDTYPEDLIHLEDIRTKLIELVARLIERLQKRDLGGRTVTIKIRFHDFDMISRSRTTEELLKSQDELQRIVEQIFETSYQEIESKRIRLLGVGLSNFPPKNQNLNANTGVQLKLFD